MIKFLYLMEVCRMQVACGIYFADELAYANQSFFNKAHTRCHIRMALNFGHELAYAN